MSAEKIDNLKVVLGQMIRVVNQNKKASENEKYVSLQVEDESGKEDTERCLLFTESEIENMEQIQFPLALKRMKAGRLYNACINKKNTFLVKVTNYFDEDMILRVSNTQLQAAESRGGRNPEDLTEKGWLTDLSD